MKSHKPQRKPFKAHKALYGEPKAKPGDNRALGLRSAAWRRLRALVLQEQPLCADCLERGEVTPATEVHHANGDPNDNRRGNLVGLCKPCHSRHTLAEQVQGRTVYGCDVNGIPLDPRHPWRIAEEKSRATEGRVPTGAVTRTPPQLGDSEDG